MGFIVQAPQNSLALKDPSLCYRRALKNKEVLIELWRSIKKKNLQEEFYLKNY